MRAADHLANRWLPSPRPELGVRPYIPIAHARDACCQPGRCSPAGESFLPIPWLLRRAGRLHRSGRPDPYAPKSQTLCAESVLRSPELHGPTADGGKKDLAENRAPDRVLAPAETRPCPRRTAACNPGTQRIARELPRNLGLAQLLGGTPVPLPASAIVAEHPA